MPRRSPDLAESPRRPPTRPSAAPGAGRPPRRHGGSDGDDVRRVQLIVSDDAIDQLDGDKLLDAGLAIRQSPAEAARRCAWSSSMPSSVSSTNLALINSEHLFNQAMRFFVQPAVARCGSRPAPHLLQRLLRLFHAILTAAADEAVGRTRRTIHYGRCLSSISHQRLKTVCSDLQAATLKPKIKAMSRPADLVVTSSRMPVPFRIAGPAARRRLRSVPVVPANGRAGGASDGPVGRQPIGLSEADQRRAFLYLLLFEPR